MLPDVRFELSEAEHCASCAKGSAAVRALVEVNGLDRAICDECLGLRRDIIRDEVALEEASAKWLRRFRCSFCDAARAEVAKLVSGRACSSAPGASTSQRRS